MNTPVNVLAMLDLARAVAVRDGLKGDALDYENAQAALARLIEAANLGLQRIRDFNSAYGSEELDADADFIHAALAGIGGAA